MTQGMTTGVTHSSGSFELLAGAGLFALFGWFLDGVFNTIPVFILIGAAFGFCISAASLLIKYRLRMDSESQQRLDRSRLTTVNPVETVESTETGISETLA